MFYYYLRDNRYRCLDLTDSRTTTAVRTTSNVGACPVVPPSLCVYRQGEPSPYLVSRVLLVELDFRGLVTLARYEQGPSTPVTSVVPSLPFPTIYLSRAPLGRPTFLPLRTTGFRTVGINYRVSNDRNTRVTPRCLTFDVTR